MKKIMKQYHRIERKGFTVVELVIVMAVSSLIIIGLFSAFAIGNEQIQLGQTKMTLESSVKEALYKMSQEIRQSAPDQITIAEGNLSIQFLVPDPAALAEADYTVDWGNAHTIQYAIGGMDNNQIIRTDTTTNQTSVIANDITSLQFTGDAAQPEIVTITVSAQRTLISGHVVPVTPLELTAQAKVRNS